MSQPEPPASVPKYLAEGIPKQNMETLHDVREYVDALIEYREQAVEADELPDAVEPVDRDDDEMGTVGSVEILRELHVRRVIRRNEGPPKVADSPVY